jgi:hypothetical protein
MKGSSIAPVYHSTLLLYFYDASPMSARSCDAQGPVTLLAPRKRSAHFTPAMFL